MLLAAVLVGLLHVAPDIGFLAAHGDQMQGIHLLGAADEAYYLTRIGAALQHGHVNLGNPAIIEHRNDPALMPALPEQIEGALGRLLGLSIVGTDILFTFFYSALLCIIAYAWLGCFVETAGPRLIGALAMALGSSWATLHPAALGYIWQEGLPLAYVRPISPVWHVIILLAAVWALFKALEPPRGIPIRIFIAGVLAGLVWHASLYVSSAFVALLGLLAGRALLRKDWNDVRRLGVIGALMLGVAIPFLLNWIDTRQAEGFADLWARYGITFTRQPQVPPALVVGTLLVFLGFHPMDNQRRWWLLACLAAGWVCINQQILTGRTLQPFHWQTNVLKPLTLGAVALTVGSWLMTSRWWQYARPLGMVTVMVLAAGSAVSQAQYYRVATPRILAYAELAPICRWLKQHAQPDDVVLSDPLDLKQADIFTTYAGVCVYLSDPFFITSLLTRQEIEHRYLAALHFYAYEPDAAKDLLDFAGGGGLFLGMQVYQGAREERHAHDRYLAGLLERYAALMPEDPVIGLRPYRVTYVYMYESSRLRLLQRAPSTLKRLIPVYGTSAGMLYRIVPSAV